MPTVPTGQGHEVYFLPISAPAVAGDTIVIPADTVVDPNGLKKRKIRIFNIYLVAKAAVSVTFKSGSVAISGIMPLAVNGVIAQSAEPSAHFLETDYGQPFTITTSADGVYGWVGFTLEGQR